MDMGAGAVMMREAVVVLNDGLLEKGENLGEGEEMEEEGKGKKGTVIRVWIYIRLFRGFLFFFFLSPSSPLRIHLDETNLLPHNRHLMVRHGLLSPNSKLLPRESESRMDVDGRPGSIMSVVSNGKGSFVHFVDSDFVVPSHLPHSTYPTPSLLIPGPVHALSFFCAFSSRLIFHSSPPNPFPC